MSERLDRHSGVAALAVFVAALGLAALGPLAERGLLFLAFVLALICVVQERWRLVAGRAAFAISAATLVSLAYHLAADQFGYKYAWLLSAPELPVYLKIANVWGGDEGTLLLLAVMALWFANRLSRRPGWAGPGAFVMACAFLAGALIWDPFAATPPELLAEAPSRGMNAHLMSVWMAVHPPLVFLAYMLLIVPVGAALEALAKGTGAWADLSALYSRAMWLVLSAGIGFGMWWAYEDFTYGTLWHWDPVQTAIFVVWCLLTAQLHCQKRYRPDGAFAISHPTLGVLSAVTALGVMAVTRSSELASSHRYLGETSLPLLLLLAGGLVAALAVCLAWRLRSGVTWRKPANEKAVLIWLAVGLFAGFAAVAAGHIALAYASSYLGLPRPETLKPFFETLRGFGSAAELDQLRAVFEQWDIDNFGLNRWLAPLAGLAALVGGHYFLPMRRKARWCATLVVICAGLALALYIKPFAKLFQGTGLTSGSTVAIFPWLELLVVAMAYLIVSVTVSGLHSAGTSGRRRLWGYHLPVALIHGGAAIALIAGLSATVFDSFAQRTVRLPDAINTPVVFPDGYALSISMTTTERGADGGLGRSSFRSIAQVGWSLSRDGEIVRSDSGHAVYRDDRPAADRSLGTVRLMCEIIDYRYARYVSDSRQMIHPFISRGLWQDVQVWVPALGAGGSEEAQEVPIVLKVFPLMSWVWAGLLIAVLGFAALFAYETAQRRNGIRPDRAAG